MKLFLKSVISIVALTGSIFANAALITADDVAAITVSTPTGWTSQNSDVLFDGNTH